MLSTCPFDQAAAVRRRETEPTWRRFPSLWETFRAQKVGFVDSLAQMHTGLSRPVTAAIASAALDKFFAERAPHSLYPYVWVRNALNPVPDAHGMHAWVHEVLVSYEASDMPDDAPIRFAHGVLETMSMKTLKFGSTTRFGRGARDLVVEHCAQVHIGPAARLEADGALEDDEHDTEQAHGQNP